MSRPVQPSKFRQPAEWAPHASTWLAWPAAEDLWLESLPAAQEAFVRFCQAIAGGLCERLDVLVTDDAALRDAARALSGLPTRLHRIAYGDIWMRDIAPVFVVSERGEVAAATFRFNGWGGKYVLPNDDKVAMRTAEASGFPIFRHEWVLEGGSVDVDGEGTGLTTTQCLLAANRNPALSRAEIEARLQEALGLEKLLWLGDGLLNDHTDGHIDNIARFVAPGVVAAMEPYGEGDPNAAIYREIEGRLRELTDARGRRLSVVLVPSPGRIVGAGGEVIPASHLNFYIANSSVVVPTYGAGSTQAALRVIAGLFPTRRVVGIDARALIAGGGSFHCISQQEPAQ